MSVRAEKVGSVIKRAISEPLTKLASEHSAGFVSVTSVKLTSDLQIAKVYINVFGGKLTPSQFLPIIDDKKGPLKKFPNSWKILNLMTHKSKLESQQNLMTVKLKNMMKSQLTI